MNEYIIQNDSSFGEYQIGVNKKIDSIKLTIGDKIIKAPSYLFKNLCNVNISEIYSSYFPVKFYYNKNKNEISCYVSGKINGFYENEIGTLNPSYVAKIIYNIKAETWNRIVIPSGYLYNYGWVYCPEFWPF